MSTVKNLEWLRDRVGRRLNFNVGQTNQDFTGTSDDPNKELDDMINQAYTFECNEAINEVGYKKFMREEEFQWPSGQLTYKFEGAQKDVEMVELRDVTNDAEGYRLLFDRSSLYWRSNDTLQWGLTGPSQTTTVRMTYIAKPKELNSPYDEPELIPDRHRDLIVWQAAIIGRIDSDDEAPTKWVNYAEELRRQFHSTLSSGNPRINDPARIRVRGYSDIY